MNLSIQVDGQQKLNQAFNYVEGRVKDWRPVWIELEQVFYNIEGQQFRSEGGRANAWAPLSEKYGKWKALHYPGRPILVLSGALKRSLTGQGSGGIRELTPTSMTLGSSIPYAIYHQRGTKRMPARSPIDLTKADGRRFVREFLKEMVEIGKRGGFDTEFRELGETPLNAKVPF